MSAAPSLAEKLSNIQHMPSLIAATVASDKPTDGYLVRDIIKMSYESIQTRVFLQKYLTNMLSTSHNVYVKIKTLKLVINLLDEGHPDFHRNLQKTPESFKIASMIKAPRIQLAGDCGRIRDLANKVLDMLYEDPPNERTCPYGITKKSNNDFNTTSGFGGGGGGGSGSGSGHSKTSNLLGGGSGHMTGFGSSSSPTSSRDQSITSQISSTVGSLFGSSKPKQRPLLYDPSYATNDSIPYRSSYMGGVGGGASGATYQRSLGSSGGGTSSSSGKEIWEEDKTVGIERRQNEEQPHETTPTISAVNNEQERKLVDEITAPGGVRAAPSRELLTTFVTRCKTLDCLAIVECLKEKLNSDSNPTILKALFVIESLIRSDIPDVLSFLDLILDELSHLSSTTSQASIKAKATKLLHQLSAVESNTEQVGSKTEENESESLLILGGASSNERVESTTQITDNTGLFAGLTLNSSSSPTAPRKTSSPPRKPQRPPPSSQSTSLLGDLTELSMPTESSPSPPKPVRPAVQASSSATTGQIKGEGDLLDFGEDNNEDEDFDPLNTSITTPSSELMTELTSLDHPPASDPLVPVQTTPLIPSSMGGLETLVPSGHTQPFTAPPTSGSPMMYRLPAVSMATTTQPIGYQPMYSGTQPSPAIVGYYPIMGNNRPVQRLPSQPNETETGSGGFAFLSKTGKGSAFDFVQDEMKANLGGK